MSAWADQRKKGGEQMKGTNFKRTGSEDGGVKNQERTTVRRTEAVLEMKIVWGEKLHIV